jgi:hypothetical protein
MIWWDENFCYGFVVFERWIGKKDQIAVLDEVSTAIHGGGAAVNEKICRPG